MTLRIHPSVFSHGGTDGDFGWMIQQDKYANAFFIFNDNEEEFLAYQGNQGTSGPGCSAGGGNAGIRPWQCATPPRAGGIPTGTLDHGGYPKLTAEVKAHIDTAVAFIAARIADHGFTDVYFSSDGHGGLGTGIFRVGADVKAYIVQQIDGLASSGAKSAAVSDS